MSFSFYNPVHIHFGIGKLSILESLINNRKALLVTSKGFKDRGIITKILNESNKIVSVYDNVESHPTFDFLRSLYKQVYSQNFDIIVALGGGSVIDAAKVVSVYNAEKSFDIVEKIIRSNNTQLPYKVKAIIAIPTTAGTGSELTPWATIWDSKLHKKFSLHLKNLWPEACICDPLLTATLSKEMTIQTGLDAFSQSLEAIWNKNANSISTNLAIFAASEIYETLPKLIHDLPNIELRTKMLKASMETGLAFSNTQTSIAHAISYYITAKKGVPHGIACSFTLPWIIKCILGENESIDQILQNIFGRNPYEKIKKFFYVLGVPLNFSDYNLSPEDLFNIYKSLAIEKRAQNFLFLESFLSDWRETYDMKNKIDI